MLGSGSIYKLSEREASKSKPEVFNFNFLGGRDEGFLEL
jgi:hypothetical protein